MYCKRTFANKNAFETFCNNNNNNANFNEMRIFKNFDDTIHVGQFGKSNINVLRDWIKINLVNTITPIGYTAATGNKFIYF